MKKILSIIVFLLATITFGFAQTLNYQAVIRDANQQLVTNTAVTVTVEVQVAGTNVFTGTFNATTNAHGLLSVPITDSRFATLDWTNAKMSCQVANGSTIYMAAELKDVNATPLAIRALTEVQTLKDVLVLDNDADNNKIINLALPVDGKDAVNKIYADSIVANAVDSVTLQRAYDQSANFAGIDVTANKSIEFYGGGHANNAMDNNKSVLYVDLALQEDNTNSAVSAVANKTIEGKWITGQLAASTTFGGSWLTAGVMGARGNGLLYPANTSFVPTVGAALSANWNNKDYSLVTFGAPSLFRNQLIIPTLPETDFNATSKYYVDSIAANSVDSVTLQRAYNQCNSIKTTTDKTIEFYGGGTSNQAMNDNTSVLYVDMALTNGQTNQAVSAIGGKFTENGWVTGQLVSSANLTLEGINQWITAGVLSARGNGTIWPANGSARPTSGAGLSVLLGGTNYALATFGAPSLFMDQLIIPQRPANPLHATSKYYVDSLRANLLDSISLQRAYNNSTRAKNNVNNTNSRDYYIDVRGEKDGLEIRNNNQLTTNDYGVVLVHNRTSLTKTTGILARSFFDMDGNGSDDRVHDGYLSARMGNYTASVVGVKGNKLTGLSVFDGTNTYALAFLTATSDTVFTNDGVANFINNSTSLPTTLRQDALVTEASLTPLVEAAKAVPQTSSLTVATLPTDKAFYLSGAADIVGTIYAYHNGSRQVVTITNTALGKIKIVFGTDVTIVAGDVIIFDYVAKDAKTISVTE